MTFSNLWPLGFLVLIPVIIILYILKQKVKDQPFSSTLLWKEIYKNLEAKTPFEKLKHNILMYLQILAMLVLILSLMAPVIRNGGVLQKNAILVIDTSASMKTLYNSKDSRLDEAKQRASAYIDGLNDSVNVTVISCGDEAQIIYQGQDKQTAQRKVKEIEALDVSGNLDYALASIGSIASNIDNVDVVCYTDSDFDYETIKKNNDKLSLVVESVYSKADNCTVDYVSYNLKESEGQSIIEAICHVTNHGEEEQTSDVSLYIDGKIEDVQSISLPAGESDTVYFNDVNVPDNGKKADGLKGMVLSAELSEKDALIEDNVSKVAVGKIENRRVLLLSEGNVFLEKALSVAEDTEVFKAEDTSVLSKDDTYDLYVFDGVKLPDDFDVSMFGNAGLLFINYKELEAFSDYISYENKVSDCMLNFEKTAITEYVEQYSFGVTEAFTYNLPNWANAFLTDGSGNVCGYYGSVNEQRVGVLGFDIHNTDIALRTEFPIFMSQFTEYLLGDELQAEISNFPTDESAVTPISDLKSKGILDKTKTGGRAIRNLLLLLAFIILVIEWIVYYKQVHSSKKNQYLIVRAILLGLIALAMAGLSVTGRHRRVETIFLVDVSDSMSGNLEDVEKYIKDNLSKMPKKNSSAVVLFGKNTMVEQFMSERKTFFGLEAMPTTTATNIENAITSACSMFKDGSTKRLILISDGCENEGNINLAAANVANNGVKLYCLEMENSVTGSEEVYIDGLDTPSVIHTGDHYNVTVTVMSNIETDATLFLYSGRISKGQKEIHLTKGNNRFVFEDVGEEGTIAQYKAVIEPDKDTIRVNNTYVSFSQIEATPKVLLIEGKDGNASEFEKILTAANIGFDAVPPNSVPISLSQLNTYKAVITLDVHYDDLRPGFAQVLESYVKDYSGGYICIGGDNSYALGRYRNTELEEILPVNMDLEGEKEIPKMAMVMVIDQSGSMTAPSEENSSVTGLDLAKQAAMSAALEVREDDEVGVLAFDDKFNWTVPIKEVGNGDDVCDAISTIGYGGGTSIYPAVKEAYNQISQSDAKIKHIILLTDGQDEFRDYEDLYEKINDAGITVSTVAVGSGSDRSLLESIADSCGGRAYYTDINNSIPRIFAKEVYLSAKTYLINEEFYPTITSDNEVLSEVFDEGSPALLGYIAATPKSRADVVLTSDRGDPILSTWQCGLGRTVAWNSDATGEWTAAYSEWENYPLFWSNIVHYVIADNDFGDDNVEVFGEGESAKLIYETPEYSKETKVTAVVSDEKGESKEVTLEPTKPGRYEATLDSDEIGIYNINIRKKEKGELTNNYNTAYANQYSPEYKFYENDGELERFVKQVDGTSIKLEDDVWNDVAKKVNMKHPITNLLIILSMLLLIFDIVARRFSMDIAGGVKGTFTSVSKKMQARKTARKERKLSRNKTAENDKRKDATSDMTVGDNAVDMKEEYVLSEEPKADNKHKKKDKRDNNNKKKKKESEVTTNTLDMNTLLQKKRDRNQ
ncbi:MAG: VWA domain-containing protein [Lachnospiraceae bacterium]|nr:VWA domain-containing protein [Lachnospiraceae bacterium]